MKKAYYLFNPGRMNRKDNTLRFDPVPNEDNPNPKARYLPIEGISALYIFGSVDANSAMYNYLGRKHIPVHFFDYYKHYTGSFSPKEYLLAGQMIVAQTKHYLSKKKRVEIARAFVSSAVFNMLKNLRYYQNRGKDLASNIQSIELLSEEINTCKSVQQLMGYEGNCRQLYYDCFEVIIEGFAWEGRRKRPPKNELNALVSFCNSMCYTLCLDNIYNSQLNPTISFLHEPGYRRYSLALDISEIFKPILVDRMIFKLCNRRMISKKHFEFIDDACFLNDLGRKVVIKEWENRLMTTIKHRKLNREVSYRHLVRLDCYKLAKYVLDMEEVYLPFRIWW